MPLGPNSESEAYFIDGEKYFPLRKMTSGTWNVRVDAWGANSFSSSELSELQAALDFAYTNRTDLKSTAVANQLDDPECRPMKAGLWGGHNSGGILKNMKRVLESGKIKVRKENDPERCPDAVAAFVKCRDVGDGRWGTIWVCDFFFSSSKSTGERAQILMHECFHLLGADEAAAQEMELLTTAYW